MSISVRLAVGKRPTGEGGDWFVSAYTKDLSYDQSLGHFHTLVEAGTFAHALLARRRQELACTCTPYWQNAGGCYTELLADPDPDCPEHFPKEKPWNI